MESDRIQELLDGLRPEFIVPVRTAMPETVDEAIKKAKAVEIGLSTNMGLSDYSLKRDYLQRGGGQIPMKFHTGQEEKGMEAIIEDKIKEGVNKILRNQQSQQSNNYPRNNHNNNNSNRNSQRSEITCRNCNRKGHFTRDCRSPQINSQRTPLKCFNCGQIGHISRNCTRQNNQNNNFNNYNNTIIKCNNCGKNGHFTRDCRTPRNSNNTQNQNTNRGRTSVPLIRPQSRQNYNIEEDFEEDVDFGYEAAIDNETQYTNTRNVIMSRQKQIRRQSSKQTKVQQINKEKPIEQTSVKIPEPIIQKSSEKPAIQSNPTFVINLVFENKEKIWISKRASDLKIMPNLYQVPGGKVDKDETSIDACIRETKEETGIKLEKNRPKLIFNDDHYNCDVYITKLSWNERPKREEPTKMSNWLQINLDEYVKLSQKEKMTGTHVRMYEVIKQHILNEDELRNDLEGSNWDQNNENWSDLSWHKENSSSEDDDWQPASVNSTYKDIYEGTPFQEIWHIFKGHKHPCRRCEEAEHHSHIICRKCEKIAFGIYKRCECPHTPKNESEIVCNKNNFDEDVPKPENRKVKDALFCEMNVCGRNINVMLDTGSQGSVISERFLKKVKRKIDKSTTISYIDINGGRRTPLGICEDIPIKIKNDLWEWKMTVSESGEYNVLLGNDWLTKACASINFEKGTFTYKKDGEYDQVPITCWNAIRDPNKTIRIEYPELMYQDELELESESEDEEDLELAQFHNTEDETKVYLHENFYKWNDIENIHYEEGFYPWIQEQKFKDDLNIIQTLAIHKNIEDKEAKFHKVQIEEGDKLIEISKEKKTTIGEIDEQQKKQLQELLQKYQDVFAKEGELGETNVFKHRIITEDVQPIKQAAYRTSPIK